MQSLDKTLLVCPTYNPGDIFGAWLHAYQAQSDVPAAAVIVDSSSDDGSVAKAVDFGFTITSIPQKSFSHGGTRQQAVDDNSEFEYIIFLTQDAILADEDSLRSIIRNFQDRNVAAVCGRQLPRRTAALMEAHARLYNYPAVSFVRSINDVAKFGLKTAFISNSFAAYRASALKEVGGFPDDLIFGEDMYVATKMLQAGYKIAYAADACVYHSHDYSLRQEMKRYFDMGVFHAREPWIRQELGGAEGEGVKFVVSEFNFLLKHAFWIAPEGLLRAMLRYIGFRLGLAEARLPIWIKKRMAMNKGFFKG